VTQDKLEPSEVPDSKREFESPLDHDRHYYWAEVNEEIQEILADEEFWARCAAGHARMHGTKAQKPA
jgi:hypothetical protein